MISAYFTISIVVGMVVSYLWLLHRLWLRRVFTEDGKPAAGRKAAEEVANFSDANLRRSPQMITASLSHDEGHARMA